mmetsp:Transcript_4391/g.27970  ORF Transcript_4391/g.27970 Transcript_4391/m.27970 type:complete len:222 (+) Transcript_4391:880-1545(+)
MSPLYTDTFANSTLFLQSANEKYLSVFPSPDMSCFAVLSSRSEILVDLSCSISFSRRLRKKSTPCAVTRSALLHATRIGTLGPAMSGRRRRSSRCSAASVTFGKKSTESTTNTTPLHWGAYFCTRKRRLGFPGRSTIAIVQASFFGVFHCSCPMFSCMDVTVSTSVPVFCIPRNSAVFPAPLGPQIMMVSFLFFLSLLLATRRSVATITHAVTHAASMDDS